ncbi:DUF3021 family protein [Facklamia miroungae]|uniref:Uncharacterized protein n=1 Tax=Facklamia miroungae TaxID=120956 RepID=A0A1G7SL51_9LACT|nr:DUF3021 family protein [Facklamia miroungae]NKZ29613.1 DUF3021 domain-containing protein [Facklamia miroungae]SDG23753.1 Protein of unknown function [Facklamia miroungae]
MFKRAGSFVQYGLLATLLTYGLLTSLGGPKVYTFLSIVVLGIVLGLLFLIYYVRSLTFAQKLASHIGASALAIIAVSLFNGWMQVAWDKVFAWILILSVLALIAYFGYHYLVNKRQNPQPIKEVDRTERVAPRADFDPRTGEVLHSNPAKEAQEVYKNEDYVNESLDAEPIDTEPIEPMVLAEAESHEILEPSEEPKEVVVLNTDQEGDIVLEEDSESDTNGIPFNDRDNQEENV